MSDPICAFCGNVAQRLPRDINRAAQGGHPLFCNRKCFSLSRRKHKTKAQKVEEKRVYDAEYRVRNPAMLRAKKHAYFKRTYDPVKAAIDRKAKMPRHVAYCQRPEYRAWKAEYDRRHSANKDFGPFAECHLLLQDIDKEVCSRMTDYEVRMANGTINKKLSRRREYERFISGCP